jgi:hypothetical protein
MYPNACIKRDRQSPRWLVLFRSSPPNHRHWYGDRERCAPAISLEGGHHVPIHGVSSSCADDRRHRRSGHGLVVFSLDHLASLRWSLNSGWRLGREQHCSPGTARGRRATCSCRSDLVHMKVRLATAGRAPHPLCGRYQLQAFECRMRKHEVGRSAASSGLPQ